MANDAAITPSAPAKLDMTNAIPLSSFSTGITSGPSGSDSSIPSNDEIQRMATSHGLDPDIINRQMMAESNGNPKAISEKGAIGLMQLMPDTAARLNVNPNDPKQNL